MKKLIIHSPKYGNKTVLYDDENHELISKYTWGIRSCIRNNSFYARCNYYTKGVGSTNIDMHRLIMHFPKGKQIDHKDGDTLNNQKNNLRECVQRQNAKNMKLSSISSTGYKGVSWDKQKQLYTCHITCNYKHIYGGGFHSPLAAAKRYNELALIHHKEFARLNQLPNVKNTRR